MSSFRPVLEKCTICGEENCYDELRSTHSFGYIDLDARPAMSQRIDLIYAFHKCPNCGYVSYDIAEKTKIKKSFIESKKYKNCEGNKIDAEAKKFYQRYLIEKELGNIENAAYYLLVAAWVLDDKKDVKNAIKIRMKVAEIYEEIIKMKNKKNSKIKRPMDELVLLAMDTLRRSKQYKEVLKYDKYEAKEEFLDDCIRFEIYLSKKKSSKCYTIGDAKKFVGKE